MELALGRLYISLMVLDDVIDNLRQYVSLSQEEIKYFFESVTVCRFRKNKVLVERGQLNSPFIFIRKGCLMTFFTDEKDFKHVIQFGMDKWWTGDLNSFMNGEPSIYTIKAMADTEVLMLEKKSFEQLCQRHHAFEGYFRVLFQNSLVSHQKRIIRNISFTAEEKYLTFAKNHPKLELLIPQKYIASYLGITPEFLSMLRRKLAKRK
ncbi:Crp/Fnr family transcriptional regulator [Indibacter alkaliphilus]|nr:Crp/Fnr family transcriptional regulator [Indibacter alkaliphilus]